MSFGVLGKRVEREDLGIDQSEELNQLSQLSRQQAQSQARSSQNSIGNDDKNNGIITSTSSNTTIDKEEKESNSSSINNNNGPMITPSSDKYWRQPSSQTNKADNIVVIHVCDENRQIKRDFVCKREILVHHMKYFQSFLSENENGYDDIDISVHCDVDIFEWLMTFIHEPDDPPKLDKTIVVSILISSEFLQMDSLVDLCLEHVSNSLGDIIKLPIDLSCISEKLINKLAFLIQPKTLAVTRDRKDKILNKLYKRRVELDFSRKAGSRGGTRSIAASLTCCQHCGFVYLEMYEKQLSCKMSPPLIDFRGKLVRRHMSIIGWSLTAYLKALHAGGMSWESIYWHVWAACQILQCGDMTLSALETDRYTLEENGIIIQKKSSSSTTNNNEDEKNSDNKFLKLNQDDNNYFSLNIEDDAVIPEYSLSMTATKFDGPSPNPYITSTLNPARPPHILDIEIFQLLTSQNKSITGLAHRHLIDTTGRSMANAATIASRDDTFEDLLWSSKDLNGVNEEDNRGRSRSPTGASRSSQARRHQSIGATSNSIKFNNNNSNKDGNDRRTSKNLSSKDAVLRSRSSSAATRNTNLSKQLSQSNNIRQVNRNNDGDSGTDLDGQNDDTDGNGGDTDGNGTDDEERELDLITTNNFRILRAMPPDLIRLNSKPGPVGDVWLETHPLQVGPKGFNEAYTALRNLQLSDRKRAEWELDMVRDIDTKRIDRIEQYLVYSRDSNLDIQFTAQLKKLRENTYGINRKREDGRTGKYLYYKDKGRQPTKSLLFG